MYEINCLTEKASAMATEAELKMGAMELCWPDDDELEEEASGGL